jgi:aspartate/methionine/tyrosine aminotransferase/NAD(P)-dependent dehydrogenase (short-subunit alcohol dehydrogenase family)
MAESRGPMSSRTGDLSDKVGVVTGAARGIGLAIVRHLTDRGAIVVAVDRDQAGLEELGQTDVSPVEVHTQLGDIREEQVFVAIQTAVDLGGLDFLVNNAGIDFQAQLDETTNEDWQRLFDINVRSVFFGCKHALGQMMERGGGSIVDIGSSDSIQADPSEPVYVATKHAVLGLTRAVAANPRYAAAGIRCNCVSCQCKHSHDRLVVRGAAGSRRVPAQLRARAPDRTRRRARGDRGTRRVLDLGRRVVHQRRGAQRRRRLERPHALTRCEAGAGFGRDQRGVRSAMHIATFAMERMQSQFEHEVRFNLTESGVIAWRLDELIDLDTLGSIGRMRLSYGEGPGSRQLRSNIASWHPGISEDQVTVMAGGAEANYTALWTIMEPGDDVAVMIPNYLQTWGIVDAYGRAVPYHLRATTGTPSRWALDTDDLVAAVTPSTKAIVVTNPNNPTGAVLSEGEMDAVIAAASRVGAWVIADEIYRGSELASDMTTPSFCGRYERLVVTGGLSKSFGLPGLRIGWAIAPLALTEQLRIHHDYLSIMPSALSDVLATMVMDPERRDTILARTRATLRSNLPRLEKWIEDHRDTFDYIRPVAGAMVYLSARGPLDTLAMAESLRVEESTLVVPAEQLGLSAGLRLGFGYDIGRTLEGLDRIDRYLDRTGVAGGT